MEFISHFPDYIVNVRHKPAVYAGDQVNRILDKKKSGCTEMRIHFFICQSFKIYSILKIWLKPDMSNTFLTNGWRLRIISLPPFWAIILYRPRNTRKPELQM